MSERRQASRWLVLAKAAVTVAILVLVLARVDLAEWLGAMKGAVNGWLLAALLASSLALLTSTLKWDGLLRTLGIIAPRWSLLKLYTIGFFVSSFLPGVVGGDVVRCYMAAGPGRRLQVAATILLERLTGVVTLVLMCLFVVAWDAQRLATAPTLTLIATMSLLLLGGLALSLNRRLATGLAFRTRRTVVSRIIRPLYKLHRTLRSFPRGPLLFAAAYSLAFYLAGGLVLFLVSRAFGVDVTLFEATAVRVLICLLTLIPISLGGLGLTQAGDIYLFGLMGVGAETALGISLMRQLIRYAYVLIGGVLFIRWQGHAVLPGGLESGTRRTQG